jgi:hypothetical protein
MVGSGREQPIRHLRRDMWHQHQFVIERVATQRRVWGIRAVALNRRHDARRIGDQYASVRLCKEPHYLRRRLSVQLKRRDHALLLAGEHLGFQ